MQSYKDDIALGYTMLCWYDKLQAPPAIWAPSCNGALIRWVSGSMSLIRCAFCGFQEQRCASAWALMNSACLTPDRSCSSRLHEVVCKIIECICRLLIQVPCWCSGAQMSCIAFSSVILEHWPDNMVSFSVIALEIGVNAYQQLALGMNPYSCLIHAPLFLQVHAGL